MAQLLIRKYQQGNVIKWNGRDQAVDDEFLKQLEGYGSTINDKDRYSYGLLVDAFRNGKVKSFDTNTGVIEWNGENPLAGTDRQKERENRRRSGFGRLLGSINHGKEEQDRRAVGHLMGFNYVQPTLDKTRHDWSKPIEAEYERDKDGRFVWYDNDGKVVSGDVDPNLHHRKWIGGANSVALLKAFDNIEGIANYGDNDEFWGYGSKEGSGGVDKQRYIDFWNSMTPESRQALRQRIENGTWTTNDREMLNDIGLLLGEDVRGSADGTPREKTEQELAAEQETVDRKRYSDAGIDYNLRNLFGVGEDGSMTIKDDYLRDLIGTNNVWLNDEFRRKYGAYADYIPEGTGIFVINGKVYYGTEQDKLNKLQQYKDWVDQNRRTGGNASSIIQYWDQDRPVSPWSSFASDNDGNPIWSPDLSSSYFGRDRSGEYVRQNGDPLVIDYYDPSNLENFDQFGHPILDRVQTAYIDPITKRAIQGYDPSKLALQQNPDIVSQYYNNQNRPTAFNPYYTIGNTGGYQEIASVGSPNQGTGASLYYNPTNGMYYYRDTNPMNNNATLNSVLSKGDDEMNRYYWNIDERLGEYIKNHPEILRDQSVRNALIAMIRNPYVTHGNGTRHQSNLNAISNLFYNNNYKELYELLHNMLNNGVRIGSNRHTYKGDVDNEFLRGLLTPEALEAQGLAYRIPMNKEGGILKHQIGGVSQNRRSGISASQQAKQTSDKKMRKADEEKVIGDKTELTATDKAELAALIADTASLGMTFIPGYGNVAGAVTGALGSLTNFGADVTRDGLDLGDVGNLALNLGLDLGTLIPGVGTAAKAGKAAKLLKNSKAVAKYMSMALSAGAAGSALATSWDKIQNGNWSISDVRTVVNGLRGATNFAKLKGSAVKKGSTSDTATLKSDNKNLPEIKLTKSEIESIEKLPKNQKADKLEELIISKLGKTTKTDDVKDILAEYGLDRSTSSDWSWKKPWKFGTSETVNTNQIKFDVGESSYRDPSKMNWYDWNRRAAIRDAKTNPDNPYFRPLHWSTHRIGDLNSIHPITPVIMSNMAPDLGVFSRHPIPYQMFDPSNPPTFYKKGGKIVKAVLGDNSSNWGGYVPFSSYPYGGKRYDELYNIWASNNNSNSGVSVTNNPTSTNNVTSTNNSSSPITFNTKNETKTRDIKALEFAASHPGFNPDTFKPASANILDSDSFSNIGKKLDSDFLSLNRANSGVDISKGVNAPSLSELDPTSTTRAASRTVGQQPGNGLGFINPDAIMGIADFAVSQSAINRQAKKQKEALRKARAGSQQDMPHERYTQFSDNGLMRMYDDRITQMRGEDVQSNDQRLRTAERLMRDSSIDQIKAQRNAEYSRMLGEYKNLNMNEHRNYDNMRTQIANENRRNWANYSAQIDQVEANKIGQTAQNIKNLIYQQRENYAKDLNDRKQAELYGLQQEAETNFRNAIAAKYQTEYNGASDKSNYADVYSYARDKYAQDYNDLQKTHYANFYRAQYNNPRYRYSWYPWMAGRLEEQQVPYSYSVPPGRITTIPYGKSGMKVTKRHRDAGEQLFLDQNKAVAKAAADLNKEIIKLFSKMIK